MVVNLRNPLEQILCMAPKISGAAGSKPAHGLVVTRVLPADEFY